ncbi:MAG: cytochrome C [Ignavibacteriaceae bacterium]|nr:cytochrome C [Ignavibacteriaceae bacterium]
MIFSGLSSAQISPGDLTKAHANLEGMSNCTKCHVLGEQINNSKCLDCHKEIGQLVNHGGGYHSTSDVKGKDCWSCHSEHHGRNFRIINFDPDNFDHSKTDFILTGKHEKTKCRDCHRSKFVKDGELKKRSKTYLGLSSECIACHEDSHQGTLGNDCNSCHNTEAFNPAKKFNHSQTAYKLTDAHIKVECIGCHKIEKKNGKDFQLFKPVEFGTCTSCHKDVHLGKFGKDCTTCHSISSFKNINRQSFDHDKTIYSLIGMHKSVQCNECHKESITAKLKHEFCFDCHSDFHKGQFTGEGKIEDCSSCHNEAGFIPSLYTIDKHNKIEFQLTGSHLAVSCQGCHKKTELWEFKLVETRCVDCHENIHGNELSEKFLPKNDCTSCHSTERWSAIVFEHDSTDFKLLGKHIYVSCRKCHYVENINKANEHKFVSLSKDCVTCHKDVHFGQFSSEENSCFTCHSFNDWKPVKFDHNKTKFTLDGGHKNIDCSRCHKTVKEIGNIFVKYKLEDFKCAACH